MDVGQATLQAVMVIAQSLVIETQQVQNGGVEIVDLYRIYCCLESKLIALPIAETLLPCPLFIGCHRLLLGFFGEISWKAG